MSAAAPLPRAEDFRFACPVAVRFRDLDGMAHVNNAAYLTYFEIARTGYMKQLGHTTVSRPSLRELFPFIVAQISCRYLAPAGLDDELTVHLRTTHIGSKSFEFQYLIRNGPGDAVALGHSTQVYFDYVTQQTLAVPAAFRACIETLEGPLPRS